MRILYAKRKKGRARSSIPVLVVIKLVWTTSFVANVPAAW
ncbi:Uncharacterised protein [Vibrio cholerae]|nr:Uncharacterised protein [Vibrio cholerae]